MKEYIIFGRSTCPWTKKAIELAEKSEYAYSYVEVSSMPSNEMGLAFKDIATEAGHKTVPCVFEINYVGGYNQLEETLGV